MCFGKYLKSVRVRNIAIEKFRDKCQAFSKSNILKSIVHKFVIKYIFFLPYVIVEAIPGKLYCKSTLKVSPS